MPAHVKIGFTTQGGGGVRLKQLDTTTPPVPFLNRVLDPTPSERMGA